jgi:aldehyde dehydrogenase (NAD+)
MAETLPAAAPAAVAVGDARMPSATRDEILSCFERQRVHQWTVRGRTAPQRIARLHELKRAIVSHREAILDAMHADFRKNRSEAELSEIQLVLTELNEAIHGVAKWMRPVPVKTPIHALGTRSRVQYESRGVVLILAAWNYPFALLFAPLVGAVAAGNCAMLRPSERVPHTSRVARQIIETVFEPEEVALIGGDVTAAEVLLDLPFDHVFFTGSTAVGRKVLAAAARHLPSITLELGGKSPAIVDETADIEHAARSIMWGKFVNAGQTCVAPDYALVHESVAEAFVAACRKTLAGFYGASEADRRVSADYCRMIDDSSWTRVAALLERALESGAKLEAGGGTDRAELYIAPTILSNVDPASPLMEDEIFGPVLPILTYKSPDWVPDFLRARPKPLAMYIFSRSQSRIDDIVSRTAAGGTVVNNCLIHLVNPGLPFGGVGESGFGSYHGRFGFMTFSHARAITVQRKPVMSAWFHPPYHRLKSGWLGAGMRLARRWRD